MFAVTRIALRCSRPRLLSLLVRPPLPRTPLLGFLGGGRRRLLTTERAAADALGAGDGDAGDGAAANGGAAAAGHSASTDDSRALSAAVGAGSSETAPENSEITDITPENLPPTITTINAATGAPATVTIPSPEESRSTATSTAAAEESAPSTTPADDATATPNTADPPPFVPPPFCPGCGAPSQQTSPTLPGYYHPRRPKSERFTTPNIKTQRKQREDEIYRAALDRLAASLDPTNAPLHQTPPILDTSPPPPPPPPRIPRCARCHAMQHHNTAPPLPSYPTLETLTGLLAASRHRRNHIYHLIDAADLPMSLQPDLRSHLWANLPRAVTRELTISRR
ncbi:uncharacterized protein LAJ45_09558 [Morchella importuna]|uniref:uncharacterized protein n=1 Tax=Morchella importuna TaxID=1174673 RepID=UPI001E8DE690|nr:uncharacterized protein LAJ45_09558 [Morchella importuna]KAH8146365.1 hypothetical protein LAJ45_09558 [Morchella importuna]